MNSVEVKSPLDAWSPMGREAFFRSGGLFGPAGVQGSMFAWYLLLWAQKEGKDLTMADIERDRKSRGYVGRGALHRYELEVLKPMILDLEYEFHRQQAESAAEFDAEFLRSLGIVDGREAHTRAGKAIVDIFNTDAGGV